MGRISTSNLKLEPNNLVWIRIGSVINGFHHQPFKKKGGVINKSRRETQEGGRKRAAKEIEAMASVVRSVLKSIKEKGVGNFIKELRDEGYLIALLDGNLMQTKIHNIGATLVGVDKFGNKYYEKTQNTQYGRHRWVEYAEKGRYNASQVPAEWHGWLHHVTDHTGDELLMLKPKRYGVEHKENFSGEGDEYIYHSKGHALNPGQRNWTRYQTWQPKQN